MITKDIILNLLELSRIDVGEDQQEELSAHLGSIFEYIGHIKDVDIEGTDATKKIVHNVLREDENPHLAGVYSNDIMREVPEVEDKFVKVPKIL